jgi:hypothetical protein
MTEVPVLPKEEPKTPGQKEDEVLAVLLFLAAVYLVGMIGLVLVGRFVGFQ